MVQNQIKPFYIGINRIKTIKEIFNVLKNNKINDYFDKNQSYSILQ